jgi:hypothetical protein
MPWARAHPRHVRVTTPSPIPQAVGTDQGRGRRHGGPPRVMGPRAASRGASTVPLRHPRRAEAPRPGSRSSPSPRRCSRMLLGKARAGFEQQDAAGVDTRPDDVTPSSVKPSSSLYRHDAAGVDTRRRVPEAGARCSRRHSCQVRAPESGRRWSGANSAGAGPAPRVAVVLLPAARC